MIKKAKKYRKTCLAQLIIARLLDADFDACKRDIGDFLLDVKLAEMKYNRERYDCASLEYWALRETAPEKLLSIIGESDFFGLLTVSSLEALRGELDILFPENPD